MTGASIETTLELWASSLRNIKSRIGPLFTQDRVAASAGLFLDGLLVNADRIFPKSYEVKFLSLAGVAISRWLDGRLRFSAVYLDASWLRGSVGGEGSPLS
jgi:hypothetical protein